LRRSNSNKQYLSTHPSAVERQGITKESLLPSLVPFIALRENSAIVSSPPFAAPILLHLALHRRSRRVLELEPVRRSSRTVVSRVPAIATANGRRVCSTFTVPACCAITSG